MYKGRAGKGVLDSPIDGLYFVVSWSQFVVGGELDAENAAHATHQRQLLDTSNTI
jgi:hypothetical protein